MTYKESEARPNRAEPSNQTAAVERLQNIVREARALLTDPTAENLNICRSQLEEAVKGLHDVQANLSSGNFKRDAALRAPLGTLRTEIAQLTILLDGAAAFHSGWVRLAASMVAGYTADGSRGEPEPTRSVWLEV